MAGAAPSRHRARAFPVLLAVLVLAGCGEVAPLGRRPRSDPFVSREAFEASVAGGASREAVQASLGKPTVARPDGSAMAFCHQETVDRQILTLALVVPFWHREPVTYFQVRGVWFDPDGKVVQARLWNGHDGPYGGNPFGRRAPTREDLLAWLEKEAPAPRDAPGGAPQR